MACPYFLPEQRLEADWPFPQRLPLGAGWRGSCTASQPNMLPSDEELKAGCNVGYATTCARLPQDRSADAVRFSKGDEHGGLVHIRFAYERDFLPAGHGELIYETSTQRWHTVPQNACLMRMAECYLESQLARRSGSNAND